MGTWLGLDRRAARHLAGRWALMRRDAALHETLARRMAPRELDALLETLSVRGRERLAEAQAGGRGMLAPSMHYSLYASLLVLWLAREAARGSFDHLAVLYVARPGGGPETFREAMLRSKASSSALPPGSCSAPSS